MRARSVAIAIAIVVACAAAGCGEEAPRARPAGSQPLPSSDPPRYTASGNPGGPMFAHGGLDDAQRARRAQSSPLIREMLDERHERARARGPQRIGGPDPRGEALSQAMAQGAAAAPADADVCERAWRARAAMHEELDRSGDEGSHREYLEACRAMPESDRRCLDGAYWREHAQECEETQRDTMQRMQRQGHMPRRPPRGT